jgi:bifunctional N-acetylglucosamine-1-phosphate-uridyltransferase/glucosamine-1-phosphate-acetyltransferase GlmU-like protein
VDDPTHYGRIVCDSGNQLLAIIEEKDASADQKEIKEINGGIYIVRRDVLFSSLKQTNTENMQGELLGRVRDLLEIGRGHILEIETPESREVLIPFNREFVKEVELTRRLIRVQPLEGMV